MVISITNHICFTKKTEAGFLGDWVVITNFCECLLFISSKCEEKTNLIDLEFGTWEQVFPNQWCGY